MEHAGVRPGLSAKPVQKCATCREGDPEDLPVKVSGFRGAERVSGVIEVLEVSGRLKRICLPV